jgi:hypothetical protein
VFVFEDDVFVRDEIKSFSLGANTTKVVECNGAAFTTKIKIDDNTSKYTLEWCWGRYERLRMCCMVFSVNEMVEFVRRYIRSGLSEAQQGLQWRSVYGDISR